ncbi:MAG TPA: hypothetical protein VGB95_04970, partial [Chitinophagales bacterium]
YVELFTTTVISFFITSIIFVFTATKNDYKKLSDVVLTYARYYLALYLLSYSFAKFYDGQFVLPNTARLEEKFGEASPMGLLWTFMGYSKTYTVFSGICEVLAGFLLFFRRTTVIGSIISFIVMTNVAVLNFAYDVPVKLFSVHLALISIFIFSPNVINLIQFFFFHKTTTLKIEKLELKNKWLKYGRIAIKSLTIIGFPILFISSDLDYDEDVTQKHNLNAVYFTEEFIKNQDTIPHFMEDSTRWDKFLIADSYAKIFFNNDTQLFYKISVDPSSQIITFESYSDTTIAYNLKYRFISNKLFAVSGRFHSSDISATFRIKRINDYPLMKQRFHWINEYPYNR